MKLILLIGTGGFIGAVARYLLSLAIQDKITSAFPFGTLAVNIIGCFFIGTVYAMSERDIFSSEWRLFLATGILGGFTTFSAFSNETTAMLREAQYASALLYVGGSVLLGLLATFGGLMLIKLW
jgi:fluoride exporter